VHNQKQYDVITFGDLCVDLIVSGGDIVPRFGQVEQIVARYDLEMGGSCSIFACQAAKLGLRVGILGRVGDDDFGQLILRRLEESGVDTQHVVIDPDLKTGLGIALCQDDDRAILTYMGSIDVLRPTDVTEAFLSSARHLHYGSFFLHTGLRPQAEEIVEQARALGLTVSLDTNWDPEERWDLGEVLSKVDLFMPNEQEALHITGCSDLQQAVDRLRALGIPMFSIKQGAKGAVAYDAAQRYACTVTPVPPGGDSVGAGDSFDAGFLAGWLRGLSIPQCLAIGCQCGRGVASATGGLAGQPVWQEVVRRLDLNVE
jgi:sugar/nucleoside kinase (ribokinase family)